MQETWVQSWRWKDPLEKENGNSFQYSCLGNPKDRGAWQATVHQNAKELDMAEQLKQTNICMYIHVLLLFSY